MRRGFLLGVVTLASCTFPDVTINDQPGDSSVGDVGNNDAKADSAIGDAPTDGDDGGAGFDTALPDTAPDDVFVPPTDGTPDFGPDAKTCDMDGDGYQPIGGACSPPAGKADCDDLNPSANPGLPAGTYYHVLPPKTLSPPGDWDCNGIVEKEWTTLGTPCAGLLTGCIARSGVDTVADCGKPLTITYCVVSGLGCVEDKKVSANQGCR